MLLRLISRVLTGEYELYEVRRSNHDELQEYDFVIKKPPQNETAQVAEDGQMFAIPDEVKAEKLE